jgi:2-polyprenyl-3-methyl-5-hydroxy-6-metoxy-1,4-benzoquinol methylase
LAAVAGDADSASIHKLSPTNAIGSLALYAAGIDDADYPLASRRRSCMRCRCRMDDLLDIGAGGGQFSAVVRTSGHRWTAVEPSPSMRARLAAIDDGPNNLACGWSEAEIATKSHDTVLAANIAAPPQDAAAFPDHCRA